VDGITSTDSQNIGLVSLNALATGADISFLNNDSSFRSLTATADGDILFDATRTLSAVDATGSLTLTASNGQITGAGDLTLNAKNGITLNSSLTTGGILTVNADTDASGAGTFTVAATKTVSTAGNALDITAADIDLQGSLTSGSATTSITTAKDETIGLGLTAGDLTIDGTELSHITAATLVLGSGTTTGITVDGITSTDSQNIGLVSLNALATGADISFLNNDSSFRSLTATADGDILFDATRTLSAVDATGSLTLTASNGQITGAGDLTLNAKNGITLNSSLTTGGILTVNADTDASGAGTFTVAATKTVSTAGNALDITAADIDLQGSLTSGSATTSITTAKDETIGLGLTAGDLTIDGTELSHITAATLVLGSGTTTGITVDGITSTDSQNIGLVSLNALATGADISFLNNDSSFRSLTATADGDILFDATRTLSAVDATGSLTLTASNGQITGAGDLTLNAKNGITLNSSLTTGGILTVNADTDASGAGTFTVAATKTVSTAGNALDITAADIDLQGSLTSGSATTSITTAKDETIGLGLTAGDLTIDGTELSHITAATLVLGSGTTTGITVDGITALQSAGIDLLTLNALGVGGTLLFTGTASAFNDLSGFATSDITVDAGLSVTPGNVVLDSSGTMTVNQVISTTPGSGGVLNVTGGVVINAAPSLGAGSVSLTATGQDLIITTNLINGSTINLQTARDIIIQALVQTTSATADVNLTADTDNDGVGGVWITSTGQLDSGRNVSVSGSDLFNPGQPNIGEFTSIRVDANGVNAANDQITAAGNITLVSSGFAPVGAEIILEGVVRSSSSGTVDVTAAKDIQLATTVASNGGAITFHSPVVLTGTSAVTSAGGAVTFDGTVDSQNATPQNLTITAGAGDVTFVAAVGSSQDLGTLSVVSSHNVSTQGIQTQVLSVNATNDITFNGDVQTTGTVTVNADTDASGAGTFTVAATKTVSTAGNALDITAADIDLQGSLTSGSATTSITTAKDETIGLGLTAGDLTIDGTELSHITAATLVLGERDDDGDHGGRDHVDRQPEHRAGVAETRWRPVPTSAS
jgi:hypothetical protein